MALRNKLILTSAATAILFALLIYLVVVGATEAFDKNLLKTTTSLQSPILDFIMIFVSSFGDGFFSLITFFAFAFALLLKGFRRESYFSFLIWTGPLLSWILKFLIARPRPEGFLLEGSSLPPDFSFPSGHVVFYTIFFGLVAIYSKYLPNLSNSGRKILFAVSGFLIVLVGISRVYLGVHWPTDVIGGYLLGFTILGALTAVYFRFFQTK